MQYPEYDVCRAALADAVSAAFPGMVLQEFGDGTPNPGVKVDITTGRGMANVCLWRNLSFDADAIEDVTGRQLLHSSIEAATVDQIEFSGGGTIDELASGLRSGSVNPSDAAPIRLAERDGNMFTLDNRRLVAVQQRGWRFPTGWRGRRKLRPRRGNKSRR